MICAKIPRIFPRIKTIVTTPATFFNNPSVCFVLQETLLLFILSSDPVKSSGLTAAFFTPGGAICCITSTLRKTPEFNALVTT